MERSYTSNAVRIVVELINRINLRDAVKTKENVEEQEDAKQDDMVEVDKAESDKSETIGWSSSTPRTIVELIDMTRYRQNQYVWRHELIEETINKLILRDTKEFEEDVVKEQDDKEDDKAEQIDPYDRMNFNWIEVQAIFRG